MNFPKDVMSLPIGRGSYPKERTQGGPLAVGGTGVGKGGGCGALVCHKGKGLRLAQTSQGAEGECGKGFGGLVGVWGDGG